MPSDLDYICFNNNQIGFRCSCESLSIIRPFDMSLVGFESITEPDDTVYWEIRSLC